MKFIRSNLPKILLWIAIATYAIYFSCATIYRINAQYAHYYDLGIMHQTTYNTYMAMATGDLTRFLEMTNTLGPEQIKRMAIHNDIILALLAPFYFIYSGPQTLLVIQAVVVALGAYGLFLTVNAVFLQKNKHDNTQNKQQAVEWFALLIAVLYLINPMVNLANLYEFHAVVLSTTFLIFMFYFWYIKRFWLSALFAVLSMLTKEQVALTIIFFTLYIAYTHSKPILFSKKKNWKAFFPKLYFPALLAIGSAIWFFVSLEIIIPAFRGGTNHFALEYYGDIGDSPTDVVVSLLKNPLLFFNYVFSPDAMRYLTQLFTPLAFLSLVTLPVLAIATPEFGVNLISQSSNMRNIYFHYTAVLTPFIFLSAIMSINFIVNILNKKITYVKALQLVGVILIGCSLYAAYSYGPLPFARKAQTGMFYANPRNNTLVKQWAKELKEDRIKVATTGKLAPYFTSRRHYYIMSVYYDKADYVVVNPYEVYKSFGSNWAIPGYEKLIKDSNYEKIVSEQDFEVYKRITF